MNTDGNTYAINRHLAEREEYDAWQEDCDAIEALADAQERIEELEAQRDELLEALEQVLIEYDDVDLAEYEPKSLTSAILVARAAIAKAKESDE